MKPILLVPAMLLLTATALSASQHQQTAKNPCPTLTVAPKLFPHAIAGKGYDEAISLFGGKPPITLTLTTGMLPPGIKLLPTGEIKGVPRSSGRYGFTVRVSDSCRPFEQTENQEIVIIVEEPGNPGAVPDASMTRKAPLKVYVTPDPKQLSISTDTSSSSLSYRLNATPPETATLDSPGASFLVNGAVIASVSAPLTAVFVNGVSELRETVTIPKKVIDQALKEKTNSFVYSRPFIGRGTTALAIIEFKLVNEKK